MDTRLDGRAALVTGGSRGIGKAIAAAFAAEGARVMITGRGAEGCEATAAEIGPACDWIAGNVSRLEDAEAAVEATVDRFGAVDILVNNAATNPYAGLVIDADMPRWDKTMAVNLTAPLVWSQLAWRRWMRERGGAIVNISSVGAYKTTDQYGVYSLSKDALIHLTRQLAVELAPGVRVNAIAPGLIRTEMARALWEGGRGERIAGSYPLKRLGEPADVANAAVFLVSEASGWMTGQTLVLDGGGLLTDGRNPSPKP